MNSNGEWLSDISANRQRKTYMKDYLDISGGTDYKDALIVRSGDVSFNDNMRVGGHSHFLGDVSINGILEVSNTTSSLSIITTTNNQYSITVTKDISVNGAVT